MQLHFLFFIFFHQHQAMKNWGNRSPSSLNFHRVFYLLMFKKKKNQFLISNKNHKLPTSILVIWLQKKTPLYTFEDSNVGQWTFSRNSLQDSKSWLKLSHFTIFLKNDSSVSLRKQDFMIRKQNVNNVDICVHINIPMFVGHINLTFSLQSHFFPHDNPRNDINSSKELNEESFL